MKKVASKPAEENAELAKVSQAATSQASCPVAPLAQAMGGECPVDHSGKNSASIDGAENVFTRSMLISATRCILTYVVFPFVFPVFATTRIGSTIGLVIGTIALISNVYTIRRFHRSDHKWKWPVTAISSGIIVLLTILFIEDVIALFGF